MALWATLLSNIPWTEVIKNAPVITDNAVKLWQRTMRRKGTDPAAGSASNPANPNVIFAGNGTPANAQERTLQEVQELRAGLSELQAEMRASSELIKALADQNAALIKRVDELANRQRKLRAGLIIFAVVAVVSLAMAISPE